MVTAAVPSINQYIYNVPWYRGLATNTKYFTFRTAATSTNTIKKQSTLYVAKM